MTLPAADSEPSLLIAENLSRVFAPRGSAFSAKGEKVVAVNDVSFRLAPGKRLGILGESGCGKTTLGRLLVLLDRPTSGKVIFRNRELGSLDRQQLRKMRRHIQIVFQDPMDSLNPRMRIGKAVTEPLAVHGMLDGRNWEQAAGSLFEEVGLDPGLVRRLPHQLSGGQRQRVCIARAIATDPDLLIADEPVASLDISIQTQILNLFQKLFQGRKRALVLIGHDVRVIRALSDEVLVMYLGQVMEQGPSGSILDNPIHPYTKLLLESVPALHPDQRHLLGKKSLQADRPLAGCPFHPRCGEAREICRQTSPAQIKLPDGRIVRCHFAE